MGRPPSLLGGCHLRDTVVSVTSVADRDSGAVGFSAEVKSINLNHVNLNEVLHVPPSASFGKRRHTEDTPNASNFTSPPPPHPLGLLFTICDSVACYTAESEERFIPESVTHFPNKISISLVFFNPFPHPTPFLQ